MKIDLFFVFDTNALISAHLVQGSVSDKAYKLALQEGYIALSDDLQLSLEFFSNDLEFFPTLFCFFNSILLTQITPKFSPSSIPTS